MSTQQLGDLHKTQRPGAVFVLLLLVFLFQVAGCVSEGLEVGKSTVGEVDAWCRGLGGPNNAGFNLPSGKYFLGVTTGQTLIATFGSHDWPGSRLTLAARCVSAQSPGAMAQLGGPGEIVMVYLFFYNRDGILERQFAMDSGGNVLLHSQGNDLLKGSKTKADVLAALGRPKEALSLPSDSAGGVLDEVLLYERAAGRDFLLVRIDGRDQAIAGACRASYDGPVCVHKSPRLRQDLWSQ